MSDLSDRLARLSPAKRALFERMAASSAAPSVIPRRAVSTPAPLSFAQERLWFLHCLDPDSPAYTVAYGMSYRGPLDRALVERGLSSLITRHETLRTTIGEDGGRPVQHIAPSGVPVLTEIDLRPLGYERALARLPGVARDALEQPFSLETGPLFRTTLVTLADDHHALLFALHHIVSDAGSMELLVREFITSYVAGKDGAEPVAVDLPIQFADYATWHREWFSGARRDTQLEYWSAQLAQLEPIELPLDAPRPPIQTFRGRVHRFSLGAALTSSLRQLARRDEATMFMTLLAGFAAFLHRYTRQRDIAIGSPIANRSRAETEPLIGLFANTIVLRLDCGSEPSADALIARTRHAVLDAHAHQDLPFEQLVEHLAPARDLSRNPLFQVFFVHRRLARDGSEASGIGSFDVPATTTKFDLTLTFQESADDLVGLLEYSSDLFTEETVTRMAAHLTALLRAMAAAPETSIDRLPMIDAGERTALLLEGPPVTDPPSDATLVSLFAAAALLDPARDAIVCGGNRMTYAELDERSARVAAALRERGVREGSLVGVQLDRSIDLVVAALAVARAGGAYVPLDPSFPAGRRRLMIDDAQPVVMIDAETFAEMVQDQVRLKPDTTHRPDPDSLAYVIYTSGSTGRPKGVQISHRALANLLLSMQREPGLTAADRLVAVTTFSFDIAGLEIWLPLITGATLVFATQDEARDGRLLTGLLARERATIMQGTPSTWRLLLDADWRNDEQLKILVGGEALPADLGRSLLTVTREFWNVYGPTETTIWSTVQRVREVSGAVPIGRPIARTRTYVLDEVLEPVPDGVIGDLYIAGDGLARGYLHLPAMTAERFVPDPHASSPGSRMYRTGDRARIRGGVLEFAGRADDQVKLRGFRIELGEIEAALSLHPSVERAAAGLRPGADGAPVLVAWCVAAAGDALDNSLLRAFLRERLPDYMVPSTFVTVDALPLTPNGKVDRRALPAPAAASRRREPAAPQTPHETQMAALWRDILRIEEVGADEDFFELGGHSMLAARLLSRVRDAFNVDMPLRALFEAPTVAGLSHAVTILEGGGTLALLTPSMRTEFLADAQLDPVIAPATSHLAPRTSDPAPRTSHLAPRVVLLTGASGFLGAHLLAELLQADRIVLCLIRCSDPDSGYLRLREIMEKYEIWRDEHAHQIVIIPGDLGSPRLGLGFDDFDRLASSVDAIYHNGALVNFVTPYRQLRSANVLGTKEVLRLACTGTPKPVHYVSTTDVLAGAFLTMKETDPLVDPDGLPHGYSQTKWVAERLIRAARERGLPVAIYRPGRIIGHSKTGISNTDDFGCRAIRGSIELGVVPDLDPLDSMSPVDFVARAIVHLSQQPSAFDPGAFHVINPEFYLWRRLFDFMRRRGYALETVTYREWRRRLGDAKENALKPLLPVFSIPPESGNDGSGQRWTEVPTPNCERTIAGLAGVVACPVLDDELWSTYFDFFLRTGYIQPPALSPAGSGR